MRHRVVPLGTLRVSALVVLLAAALSSMAAAETVTAMLSGDDLLRTCVGRKGRETCFAYIEGVADSLARGDRIFGWRACVPPGTSSDRLRNVAVRFLKGHAEARGNSAASLVAASLGGAFPCPQ